MCITFQFVYGCSSGNVHHTEIHPKKLLCLEEMNRKRSGVVVDCNEPELVRVPWLQSCCRACYLPDDETRLPVSNIHVDLETKEQRAPAKQYIHHFLTHYAKHGPASPNFINDEAVQDIPTAYLDKVFRIVITIDALLRWYASPTIRKPQQPLALRTLLVDLNRAIQGKLIDSFTEDLFSVPQTVQSIFTILEAGDQRRIAAINRVRLATAQIRPNGYGDRLFEPPCKCVNPMTRQEVQNVPFGAVSPHEGNMKGHWHAQCKACGDITCYTNVSKTDPGEHGPWWLLVLTGISKMPLFDQHGKRAGTLSVLRHKSVGMTRKGTAKLTNFTRRVTQRLGGGSGYTRAEEGPTDSEEIDRFNKSLKKGEKRSP